MSGTESEKNAVRAVSGEGFDRHDVAVARRRLVAQLAKGARKRQLIERPEKQRFLISCQRFRFPRIAKWRIASLSREADTRSDVTLLPDASPLYQFASLKPICSSQGSGFFTSDHADRHRSEGSN